MKRLFVYLALVNMIDGALTVYGLSNSFIEESNPIMNHVYEQSPVFFIVLKALLSAFLLVFIFIDKIPRTNGAKSLTYIASFMYTLTLVIHCLWLWKLPGL
ncbi:DUF5658 family protein [Radiobacillus sp. PE A8.2]|uniref:DUF5658 family protein n=1 Tax=Radiobacillus sp. PE A8.2 TaxID=3380349 RepID=UPI003890F09D